MKNKPSLTQRILYNDNLIKILSLLFAILFWFIVVMNVDTGYKRTVYNVPVNIDESSATLTSVGLHVVDMSHKSISIEVSGTRNLIGALSAKDFVVTPNLSKVTKSGKYEIQLAAALKSPDNRIKIEKVNPSYITVAFDTMVTKTLPVQVKVEGGNVPDGYLMQNPVSSPTSITISGPTADLAKVDKATANISISDGANKSVTDTSEVKLIDKNGDEVTSEHIQKSNKTVEITVPILKTKSVSLHVNFTNVPKGVDSSKIAYTVSPANIIVAGSEDNIKSLNEIVIGSIDFRELDLSTDKTLDIDSPNGVVNVENVTSAKVNVNLTGYTTKNVDTTTFSIINKPDGYTITNKTKKLTNIKLFGPADSISSVDTVTAIIDMSAVQSSTGTHEVPVTFEVPDKYGFWVTDKFNVIVSVRK